MKQSGGLLGSSGPSPGGANEAQASGDRGPGRKEGVTFQQTQIHPNELDPSGTIVGELPFDGEAPTGESLLKIQKIITSGQASAEKVERQAIPAEYRDLVRRFQDSLRQPAEGGAGSGAAKGE